MQERGKHTGYQLSPIGVSALARQMAELLRAGILPEEGAALLRDDAEDTRERAMLDVVTQSLEMGQPLSAALAEAGAVPDYFVRMLEIGERTGTMEEVLQGLADYYEREAATQAATRSAVIYPVGMAVLMAALLVVLAVFVLPVFSDIYATLGLELSPVAMALMTGGRALGVVAGVAAVVLLAGGLWGWLRWKKGGLAVVRNSRAMREAAAGRFASALALMLRCGLSMEESLERAGALIDHPIAHQTAETAVERLNEGKSLSEALEGELFSGYALRLIRVGERTGRTDTMLEEAAQRAVQEAAERTDKRIAAIEPTVVAVLAVLAGLMLLSVMLPLLGVLSAMG